LEWKWDVVDKKKTLPGVKKPTKKEMSEDILGLENSFKGCWCHPCMCCAPLVWDEKESPYYHFSVL
jgi:hypothetical protein